MSQFFFVKIVNSVCFLSDHFFEWRGDNSHQLTGLPGSSYVKNENKLLWRKSSGKKNNFSIQILIWLTTPHFWHWPNLRNEIVLDHNSVFFTSGIWPRDNNGLKIKRIFRLLSNETDDDAVVEVHCLGTFFHYRELYFNSFGN